MVKDPNEEHGLAGVFPEESEEGPVDEDSEEAYLEVHSGVLFEEGVFVEDPSSLLEHGYGFEEAEGVLLPDVTALHLMRRGLLEVSKDGRRVGFDEILQRGLSSDAAFFLKYLVLRDMRSRGRVIRAPMGDMQYLWFYEKPSRPSSHIVAIYSRNQSIPLVALDELLSIGSCYKKGVYLALVDEEGEVSYYEIKRFTTRPGGETKVERMDFAQNVGPMTVVWDKEGALSLYREGYYGKPIGIRKPRSMDFERPITLSFTESLYLSEKGRIRLTDDGEEVAREELLEKASAERDFEERLEVYRILKESGLVVKSGMKFGVDFAVYEYGPGLDHAPFLIHVYRAGASITPTEIVRAGRLAASVKKKFIVARVEEGGDAVKMLGFTRVKP